MRQTPEMIAETALQEDADVIGISILSGAHMALVPRLMELLLANGQENVKVFVGGIIPETDISELLKLGVLAVYGPGTSSSKYVQEIQQAVWGRSPA